MQAIASFNVTGWEPQDADDPDKGPALSRVVVRKTFTEGDLQGESAGEGLFCGMEAPEAGAGYVVSERFTGRLGDRHGSFVMQHGGLMGAGMPPRTFGNVVPGSGTGDLAGLTGRVEIARTEDGGHTLTLDYTLASGAPA